MGRWPSRRLQGVSTATLTAGPPAAEQPPRWRATAQVLRSAAAVGGGVLLYLSFPPLGLWWLAPVALALLGLAVHDRRARAGFGYGVLFGLASLLPLLVWTGEFVGALPWLALSTFEASVIGLAGAAAAVVWRLPAGPLWAACGWVAMEALRARVPFGGFPWAKIAFSQPEGVFLPIAAVGGTPLLGFAVVLCGFGAASLVLRLAHPSTRSPRRLALPALLAVLPPLAGLAAAGLVSTAPGQGTVTAAVVQGNVPRAGLDFNAQRRAVLDNHVARTEQLAAAVAAGRVPQPDLVIWPENASDIDPLRNPDAAAVISRAVRAIDAPTLVGTVLVRDDGVTTTNSALVWVPGQGPVDRYDKRRIQPFGEYLPYRDFFALFSRYAEQAGHFVPGTGDGTVRMAGVTVGVATCWEIAFDAAVADSVRGGAQLLAVPTNNATFGYTDMTYQQLAMSRVRAVEHGRAVLVAATSGVSAVIRPDGSVERRTSLFTPDAMVTEVPLRSETTLATRLGAAPEWALVALGITAVLVGAARQRRERR